MSQPQPHACSAAAAVSAAAAGEPRTADGIREVRRLFQAAQNPPRWPMYVRQVKQFLRGVDPTFDERKFGFASLNDLLRACQREGLFRMERDRQGVMRFFQGNVMKPVEGMPTEAAEQEPVGADDASPEAPSGRSARAGDRGRRRRSRGGYAPDHRRRASARADRNRARTDRRAARPSPSRPAEVARALRQGAEGKEAGQARARPERSASAVGAVVTRTAID